MKTEKELQLNYTLFDTTAGWCGITGINEEIYRFFLPAKNKEKVLKRVKKREKLAKNEWKESPDFAPSARQKIIDYLAGKEVDFSDIKVNLDGLSPFARDILSACRTISYGQTVTYAEIASLAGHPKASRAAGNALASNPLPIIIPCHRVVKADGTLGGYLGSKEDATHMKKFLLDLERSSAVSD